MELNASLPAHQGPRALARARAAHIRSQQFANRDRVKAKLLEDKEISRSQARAGRQATQRRWKLKTRHSPVLVDLVAENERLDEENKVRLAAEAHQLRLVEKQRVTLKHKVLVRALREESDLDAQALKTSVAGRLFSTLRTRQLAVGLTCELPTGQNDSVVQQRTTYAVGATLIGSKNSNF